MSSLHLISHILCPYVQRVVITLTEKNISFKKTYIDLGNKPDWFLQMSPLGKTPLLIVDESHALFESAVICEYLEDVYKDIPLHPSDPLLRAKHRAWIEFGSAILNDIAGFYMAPDAQKYSEKKEAIHKKWEWLEKNLDNQPFFSGASFSMVDAVFGPVFRYFDVFESFIKDPFFKDLPKVLAWREKVSQRESVQKAVTMDYPQLLLTFLKKRNSHISTLI